MAGKLELDPELQDALEGCATFDETVAVLTEWASEHGGAEFAGRIDGKEVQGRIAANPKAGTKH